ncbi:hypothetical protein GCM10009532_30670 [Microbacterium aurantiacum]
MLTVSINSFHKSGARPCCSSYGQCVDDLPGPRGSDGVEEFAMPHCTECQTVLVEAGAGLLCRYCELTYLPTLLSTADIRPNE